MNSENFTPTFPEQAGRDHGVEALTDSAKGPYQPAETGETVKITNSEFIAEVFVALPDGATPMVTTLHGNPEIHRNWSAVPWPHELPETTNTYFALASFYPGDDGVVRRRKTHFAALHAVLLDHDLGTKASLDRLGGFELSWLIDFRRYFAEEMRDLQRLADEGLVELTPDSRASGSSPWTSRT